MNKFISHFYKIEPTLEHNWRAINLFGRNTATYKFALAKCLLEFSGQGKTRVTIEDLANQFSSHICEHLKREDKQITSNKSKFIDACRMYNNGSLSKENLQDTTVKLAFTNVIDRFHNIAGEEASIRFYEDTRVENKSLILTDNLLELASKKTSQDLYLETETRWRLVEAAWSMDLSTSLIRPSEDLQFLVTDKVRRKNLASARDALIGYQKGKCFYCFISISLNSNLDNFCEVDHFFPFVLKQNRILNSADGIWNLVLSCKDCNGGKGGKFHKVPDLSLVQRLHQRNEYYVSSHDPLKEAIIAQTGYNLRNRKNYLQKSYNLALQNLLHSWKPKTQMDSNF